MCASCGCNKPEDKHGDERHITMSQIKAAADAAGVPVDKVVANIEQASKGTAQR